MTEEYPFYGLIADSVLDLIGRTPVVRIQRIVAPEAATIWAKLERQNPGGSVKERIALSMISAAEKDGKLQPGGLVVEATSGNTGIGLAMVAAVRGYRLVLVMPDSLSVERRQLFAAYGAELVLTPGQLGITGALAKVNEIVERHPEAFVPSQFENPANPAIHRLTTVREILAQVPHLDAFVAGVGTGGTISGIGGVLKHERPHVQIIAVEPDESPVLSGGEPGKHGIQGIGAGIVPAVFERDVVDSIIRVKTGEAIEMTRQLARREGLLVGISSGAAMVAASRIAERLGRGRTVVTLFPDSGERYLSTGIYEDQEP